MITSGRTQSWADLTLSHLHITRRNKCPCHACATAHNPPVVNTSLCRIQDLEVSCCD